MSTHRGRGTVEGGAIVNDKGVIAEVVDKPLGNGYTGIQALPMSASSPPRPTC